MKFKFGYHDPIQQVALFAVACLLIELLALGIVSQDPEDDGQVIWVISCTCLLLFAFLNATMQLKTENHSRYLTRSIYGYLAMLVLTIGIAAGLTVGRAASFDSMRTIYLTITLCYVIFLIIVFMMRKIMDYAQRQDQELRN